MGSAALQGPERERRTSDTRGIVAQDSAQRCVRLGIRRNLGQQREPGVERGEEAHGLLTAEDRRDTIGIRELRAVRLLLAGNFAARTKDRAVRKLLLWEENMACVGAINTMESVV